MQKIIVEETLLFLARLPWWFPKTEAAREIGPTAGGILIGCGLIWFIAHHVLAQVTDWNWDGWRTQVLYIVTLYVGILAVSAIMMPGRLLAVYWPTPYGLLVGLVDYCIVLLVVRNIRFICKCQCMCLALVCALVIQGLIIVVVYEHIYGHLPGWLSSWLLQEKDEVLTISGA